MADLVRGAYVCEREYPVYWSSCFAIHILMFICLYNIYIYRERDVCCLHFHWGCDYCYTELYLFSAFTYSCISANCFLPSLMHIFYTWNICMCVEGGWEVTEKLVRQSVCECESKRTKKKIDCKFPSVKRKAVVFSNFWPCCISYVCISYLSARFTLAEGVWNDKFLAAALCLVRQCKLDTKMFTHSLVFPFFSNDTNVIALESRVKLSTMSLCSELFSVFCVCVCCLFFAGACDSAYQSSVWWTADNYLKSS